MIIKYHNQKGNSNLKMILIFAILILVIFSVFFIIQIVQKYKNKPIVKEEDISIDLPKEEDSFVLPSSEDEIISSSTSESESLDMAEEYRPGDFYKSPKAPEEFKANYDLPINIKTDTANYYDFSRKINLDNFLPDLNSRGFAVIDNPFESDNFYDSYQSINDKQLPPLITSDFLIYYYQNTVKLAYKKIESAVFYNNLWETNKKLYEIAKTRYEKKEAEKGLANDITLEGARRELVFLAVSLSLLQPQEEQIKESSGLDGNGKFSTAEAEEFSFDLPDYLVDDVFAELSLIYSSEKEEKSPVLLYVRDYSVFSIPEEYKINERLKNFYLTSRWLNSIWPLYAKGDDCPNCLLDKDDWRVSFYSSLLLAEDIYSSQELKNKWAQIYKIQSFFIGLRSELNYLHYKEEMDKVFGAEEKIFDFFDDEDLRNKLDLLAEEIGKKSFPAIEGGLDRNSSFDKSYTGLRMLAESQWPQDYIFNNLTGTSTGAYLGGVSEASKILTACVEKKESSRCLPAMFDVLNLTDAKISSDYVGSNSNYEFYPNKIKSLKNELEKFTDSSWHKNIFWLNLDIVNKIFLESFSSLPIFAQYDEYKERILTRSLASLVNFQLPPDEIILSDNDSSRLGDVGVENDFIDYGYIEPNQVLVGELLANTQMTIDFLNALKIGNISGAALYDLRNLKDDLLSAEEIIKKEAAGENLDDKDHKFIFDLYNEFSVVKKGEKFLDVFGSSASQKMREDISGVKILLLVYLRNGEKIITAGPVFNYQESRFAGRKK